jgi:hypothetical protein
MIIDVTLSLSKGYVPSYTATIKLPLRRTLQGSVILLSTMENSLYYFEVSLFFCLQKNISPSNIDKILRRCWCSNNKLFLLLFSAPTTNLFHGKVVLRFL